MSDQHSRSAPNMDQHEEVLRGTRPIQSWPPSRDRYTEHIRLSNEQSVGDHSLPRTAAFNDRVQELHQRVERIQFGTGSSSRSRLSRSPSPIPPGARIRGHATNSQTVEDQWTHLMEVYEDHTREIRALNDRLSAANNRLQTVGADQLTHVMEESRDIDREINELNHRILGNNRSLGIETSRRRRYAIFEQSLSQIDDLITQLENDRSSNPTPTATRSEAPTLSTPAATRYLDSLRVLFMEDLPVDQQTCSVCQEPYLTKDGHSNEEVVILPECGHIFGHSCIQKWLDPNSGDQQNTCPLCRDVLFEVPHIPEILPNPLTSLSAEEYLGFLEQLGFLVEDQDTLRVFRSQSPSPRPIPPHLTNLTPMPFLPSNMPRNLLSNQILFHLRHFTNFTGHPLDGAEATQIARALAHLMGQLYVRLKDTLAMMHFSAPWREKGPPISFLLDPEIVLLLEIALEKMVQVEEIWTAMRDDVEEGEERGRE